MSKSADVPRLIGCIYTLHLFVSKEAIGNRFTMHGLDEWVQKVD